MMKIILIILGVALLSLTGYTAFNSKKLLDEGIVTKGKVVSFEVKHKKEKKKDKKMYYPIVSFQDEGGISREFKSNTGSNPKSYNVGEFVEVIYRKNEVQSARINSFISMWLLPLILGIFGLIIFVIGIFIPRSGSIN